jgi:antitoxin HigA-1
MVLCCKRTRNRQVLALLTRSPGQRRPEAARYVHHTLFGRKQRVVSTRRKYAWGLRYCQRLRGTSSTRQKASGCPGHGGFTVYVSRKCCYRLCRIEPVLVGNIVPRAPIHPGEHLAEELRELGISAAELSRQINVPVNRITGIIHGQRGITADTALRLGHWFGTSPEFWMNLQQTYELRVAENEVGAKIAALPRRAGRLTSRKLGKIA